MARLPTPHDHRRPRGRGDNGAATVEFALLAPLFVMLLFGVIEVSRGYNAKVELTSAVREGARSVALKKATPAADVVTNAAPGLHPAADVTVDSTCTGATPTDAKVTATYEMPYSIPFVSHGTWTIHATGVMRCGL